MIVAYIQVFFGRTMGAAHVTDPTYSMRSQEFLTEETSDSSPVVISRTFLVSCLQASLGICGKLPQCTI